VAIKAVTEKVKSMATHRVQYHWLESYFWDMLQRQAVVIAQTPSDTPRSKTGQLGPLIKEFCERAQIPGESSTTMSRFRNMWSLLAELRKNSAKEIVLYRIPRWNNALKSDLEDHLGLNDLKPWVKVFRDLFRHLNLFITTKNTATSLRSYEESTPMRSCFIELQCGPMPSRMTWRVV